MKHRKENKEMPVKNFILLKPVPGKCQECAVDHLPDRPHDRDSLYYQFKFFKDHGRYPTWENAIAHCNQSLRIDWKLELKLRGVWTENKKGGTEI